MAQVEPLRFLENAKPPSQRPSRSSRFLIGNRVVKEQAGLCKGFYVSRAQALHFAILENGGGLQTVVMVPRTAGLGVNRSDGDPTNDSWISAQAHIRPGVELRSRRWAISQSRAGALSLASHG